MSSEMVSTLVVLLTVAISSSLAEFDCPTPSTILPCTCRFQMVSCSNVKNITAVKETLVGKISAPFTLSIEFKNKAVINEESFSKLNVRSLYLYGSDVQFVGEALANLTNSLSSLYIRFKGLTAVPGFALSKLHKLKVLYIQESKSLAIYKKDIDQLPQSIDLLNFDRSTITHIDERALVHLPNLLELKMRKCNLKTFPLHITSAERFRLIDLRNNFFTSIPFDSLNYIYETEVLLEYNKIQYANNQTEFISFLDRGNYVGLDENLLYCTCQMKWIPKYRDEHLGRIMVTGECYGDSHYRRGLLMQQLHYDNFEDC